MVSPVDQTPPEERKTKAIPVMTAPSSSGHTRTSFHNPGDPLPFGGGKGGKDEALAGTLDMPVKLSIEDYALIIAMRAHDPEGLQSIEHQISGGDTEARIAAERQWEDAIASDPVTRERFDEMVTHYSNWIQQKRS